jgi:hypothetical protein
MRKAEAVGRATRKKSDITAFFGRAAKHTAVAADANHNNPVAVPVNSAAAAPVDPAAAAASVRPAAPVHPTAVRPAAAALFRPAPAAPLHRDPAPVAAIRPAAADPGRPDEPDRPDVAVPGGHTLENTNYSIFFCLLLLSVSLNIIVN